MAQVIIDTANHIAGYAAKAARVKVVAAYPITPQTTVVEKIADFVESGEMDAEYIRVESEHSAMVACIAAAAAGVRTFTATSAHGLALMHEALHWAAGSRLPVVMVVVNRAMGAPWSIWPDFSDSLSQRDTGWIQFYCADNQEVFDTVIQAYKLCEDERVFLPAMVCLEGFILSHTYMPVKIPEQKKIDDFLPPYKCGWILDVNRPLSHANLVSPDWYMEFRYVIQEAMENAKQLIPKIDKDYSKRFGFEYGGLIEKYKCDDADLVLVTMGTMASDAKIAVGSLRKEGLKVGVARVRVFRPFPTEEIAKLAEQAKMLATIDRHISFGMEGFLASEIKASLFNRKDRPLLAGFVAGLGGRDVTSETIKKIAKKSLKQMHAGKVEKETEWVDLRE
ncbi:MAG: transketolase C-terminal domain-containing protein [Candidatus Bathyarchaeota archaeon]|jgi:2-oxoisovalerate ferredoxin oxidoreductase alpha subunit|nr:pyruvate ferredoxin oxidoreductase [Candidatus Bathyarchaeota archaeon A05DMB-5]MDH7557267.1 transketolase C-terminal domain-containing protein [Candidatus Bathyarchaeota archaeon]